MKKLYNIEYMSPWVLSEAFQIIMSPLYFCRKTSLMFNNQSITPVETEEKQFSVKGLDNDSQDHSESSRRPAALEPVTKLSVSNLSRSQVAQPDSIRVTDNGTPSSAKVNKYFKGVGMA